MFYFVDGSFKLFNNENNKKGITRYPRHMPINFNLEEYTCVNLYIRNWKMSQHDMLHFAANSNPFIVSTFIVATLNTLQ